jgi:NAD+ synthase
MPCHSRGEDKNDAKLVSDYYGFPLYNFNLTDIFDNFKNELDNIGNFDLDDTKNSDINLKPRLRMATLYYLAALFSKINNKTYLVAGTSNKCELYVGYFTKGGDNIHDIAILADFTVEEVIKIGEYLNVPPKVLYKKPDDGLSNQSDEDKLGVTYKDIANYITNENSVDLETGKKIKQLHDTNKHKFFIPTYRRDD